MYFSRGRLIALLFVIIFILITIVFFVQTSRNFTHVYLVYSIFVFIALLTFANERARIHGIPLARRFLALRVLSLGFKFYAMVVLLYAILAIPSILGVGPFPTFLELIFNTTILNNLMSMDSAYWIPMTLIMALVLFSVGQAIDWGLALEENTRHTATVLVERFRARPSQEANRTE